jgi:hypothetical protein
MSNLSLAQLDEIAARLQVSLYNETVLLTVAERNVLVAMARPKTCGTCAAWWVYTNTVDEPMDVGSCRRNIHQDHEYASSGPATTTRRFGCSLYAPRPESPETHND